MVKIVLSYMTNYDFFGENGFGCKIGSPYRLKFRARIGTVTLLKYPLDKRNEILDRSRSVSGKIIENLRTSLSFSISSKRSELNSELEINWYSRIDSCGGETKINTFCTSVSHSRSRRSNAVITTFRFICDTRHFGDSLIRYLRRHQTSKWSDWSN